MAHYAFINNDNVVVEVIPGRDEEEIVAGISDWEAYYTTKRDGLTAVRTSYNTWGGVHYDPATREPSEDQTKALRYNYAGKGFSYDPERDAFIPPKPFESWVLDETTCLWQAPIPMPEETDENGDPVPYVWDESVGEWVVSE